MPSDFAVTGRSEGPQDRRAVGFRLTWTLLLVATVLGLLVLLPSLPAAWRGLSNVSTIGDVAFGNVSVTGCSRGDLVFDWTCHGVWAPNDVMATPVKPMMVTVVNNARHQATGDDFGYVFVEPGTHAGFNAGETLQMQTIALWVGVLCGVATLVLLALTRRRRNPWPAAVTFLAGVVLVTIGWPLISWL